MIYALRMIVLFLNTMKLKLLFLMSLLILLVNTVFAEEIQLGNTDSLKANNMLLRQEQRHEYYSIYSPMPSLLSDWSHSDFAYISAGNLARGGSYHAPQFFNKTNFLEVKTESILSFPDKKWRFYGEFGYKNGFSDGGEWNLFYNPTETGSPYYFMQGKPGKWAFQTYEFKTGIAKTLPNNKISLGLGINYAGILSFRSVDSRNENYRLDINITPSVTVKLNTTQTASLGLIFIRNKVEPQIYDKYQHGSETEFYQVFFNEGLGTWNSNPSQLSMGDNRYGAVAAWTHKTKAQSVSVIYEFATGKENWELNSYSNQSALSGNIARYSFLTNSLTASYNKNLAKGILDAKLVSKLIIGDGSPYRPSSLSFNKNYISTMNHTDFAVSFLPKSGHLKRGGIGLQMDSRRQKDLNYEHTISFVNQTSSAWLDFIFGDVHKGGLLLGLNGGYHSNLSYVHTPKGAVNNFYNTKIAIPAMAYLTSNYFIAGTKLGTEFDLNQNYHIEISLDGELCKPTRINYAESSAQFSISDSFYNIKLNLSFNF